MAKGQPKIKEPETWDEFLVRAWGHFRSMNREDTIPASNYPFQPGEEVIFGNQPDVRVEEVHDNGRILVLSHHDRGEVRGKPYDNQRRLPIVTWWNHVYPKTTVKNTNFSRPRLHGDYRQSDLRSLLDMTYHRGLIDSPIYQRDYVWALEDKQRLIGSVFARVDIGKFVFLEHPHPEYRLEIVDGKQRLAALRDFREGRFPYKGHTWFELSGADKFSFGDIMTQMVLLNGDVVKPVDVLRMFLDLNEGGVPQTSEHVRKVRELYEKTLAEEKK
jgi:hypothetical protein